MKFDYKIVDVNKSQVTEQSLKNLGNNGWELVIAFLYSNGSKIYALFKRRK